MRVKPKNPRSLEAVKVTSAHMNGEPGLPEWALIALDRQMPGWRRSKGYDFWFVRSRRLDASGRDDDGFEFLSDHIFHRLFEIEEDEA